jgi:hypothetical protein
MVGMPEAGVAGEVDVEVIDLALGDDVEAPEGEEDEGLDAGLARGVGEDERGIGLVEAAVRADDRDLYATWFMARLMLGGLRGAVLRRAGVRGCGETGIQRQPAGLGMPAILAMVRAGALGKSA